MTDESTVRVGIAAHQELLLAAIANLVDQSRWLKIVGRLCSPEVSVLRNWILETRPEVVVTADRLAVTVLQAVTDPELAHSPRAVVLTTSDEIPGPGHFIAAGACAVLDSRASVEDVAMTVRLVSRGHGVLNASLAPGLVGAFKRSASSTDVPGLTPRERDVLDDIGSGYTNGEIAARRSISVGTVKVHLRSIKEKTGEESRAGLIALAVRSEASRQPAPGTTSGQPKSGRQGDVVVPAVRT